MEDMAETWKDSPRFRVTDSTMAPSQYNQSTSSWAVPEGEVDRTRPGTTLSVGETPRSDSPPTGHVRSTAALSMVDEQYPEAPGSPCGSAVSDTTSLAAEEMSKEITASLQSVALVSVALEARADEDGSQPSHAQSLRPGQNIAAEMARTCLEQLGSRPPSRSQTPNEVPKPLGKENLEPEAANVAAAKASEASMVAEMLAAIFAKASEEAQKVDRERLRLPEREPDEARELLASGLVVSTSIAFAKSHVASESATVASKPEDEAMGERLAAGLAEQMISEAMWEAKRLQRPEVSEIASEGSSGVKDLVPPLAALVPALEGAQMGVEVASEVSLLASQAADDSTPGSESPPRRSNSLVVPSQPVQEEVMSEVDALADASTAPLAPFGIMVTDSESRKSVVLLEAPVLEAPSPPAEDTDSEASAVEAEEGPVVPIMDGVEEAIRQAVRDETALEAEDRDASLVDSEDRGVPLELLPSQVASDSGSEVQEEELPLAIGIMITDTQSRQSVVLLEPPVGLLEPQRSETDAMEEVARPVMDGVEEAIRAAVREEVTEDLQAYREASLVDSEERSQEPQEAVTRMPSRAATEVTIMPPDAEKTMDELLDEIDVLRASLTFSDELPGPQALGVSLTQPFSDLLGEVEKPGTPESEDSLQQASRQDAFEQTLAEELVDAALLREFRDLEEARQSSEVLEEQDAASEAATVAPAVAEEQETARVDYELSLRTSLREALDSEAGTVTLEEAQELEEEREEQALLLTRSLTQPFSESEEDARTVAPEVAQEAEERLEEQRVLESSLREALIQVEPEVAALDDLGGDLAKELMALVLRGGSGLRDSSEVLTVASEASLAREQRRRLEEQMQMFQDAQRPASTLVSSASVPRVEATGASSDAETVSPEAAREDEERLDQQRTLQNSLREALTTEEASDAETVPPEVAQADEERLEEQRTLEMSLRDALAPKILEAFSSREETKPASLVSSCTMPEVEEGLGELIAQELLAAAGKDVELMDAAQLSDEASKVSRPASEVTIAPGRARKTKDELLDEIDVLAASLTLPDEASPASAGGTASVVDASLVSDRQGDIIASALVEWAMDASKAQEEQSAQLAVQLLLSAAEAAESGVSAASVLCSEETLEDDRHGIQSPESVSSAGTEEARRIAAALELEEEEALKELGRKQPEVELHHLDLPFRVQSAQEAVEEASTVSPVSPPPPRISAMEAESDSSEAELASVPGRPVAVLRSEDQEVSEVQDQEDLELMAVVSEALKLDVEPETPSEGHTISRLEGESSYSLPEDVSAQVLQNASAAHKVDMQHIALVAEALAKDVMSKELEVEEEPMSEAAEVDPEAIAAQALAQDVLSKEVEEEVDAQAIAAQALAQDVLSKDVEEEVDTEAIAAQALAQDVLSKEVEEEVDAQAIAAQALAQDVLSKEVQEEVDAQAIVAEALAHDVLSKEVEEEADPSAIGSQAEEVSSQEVAKEADSVAVAAEALASHAQSVEVEPEEEPPGESTEDLSPGRPRSVPRPPAGSGLSAAVARRLAEHTIEGLKRIHEQENRELEASLKERFYTPAPGTKLPMVMSLPSLSMEPGKARDETKRILRLNYHRVVGTPAIYQHHRKRSGEDVEDVKLHSSPELREQRFLRQRELYQSVPGNYHYKVSPPKSKKAKTMGSSRSSPLLSPLLPPATSVERRPPKLRPLAKGADNLRKLADGQLPVRVLRS